MKIFVTGADGFIGSHLCEALVREGHEVVAGELFTSRPVGWLSESDINIRRVGFDIREPGSSPIARHGDFDVVYHLGALIDVPASAVMPEVYLDTNIKGTLGMAGECSKTNTRLIFMSTSEVYGGSATQITEDTPTNPKSIYAATKLAGEQIVNACRYMYGLDATIVRCFNTYGPRQSRLGVISDFIGQYLDPDVERVKVGNENAKRDYLYVSDTVAALMSLLREEVNGPVNIASGRTTQIGEIRHIISRILGEKPVVTDKSRYRDGYEVEILWGDATALTALTGWKPKVDLYSGLTETIKWWAKRYPMAK